MPEPRFIHLRLHTEYSLLEGAMRVKKLPAMVGEAGMPAVAVTDTNNMFCALEFSETAAKAGVQPILGCQIDVDFDVRPGERPVPCAPAVLLVKTRAGLTKKQLNEATTPRSKTCAATATFARM